ncbi:MAG: dienelactone hydrolase family protein [Solirubrobacteraceae bacterium]|nr:dienelactone hydrolase family protein [Solirubrobacteraceae bacterium]
MCFAYDAHPPDLPADLGLPPLAGGAAAEIIELGSADGTRFSAGLARTPEGSGLGVVILPDVRGLYRFYAELAERFAQAGHDAIAIDYFGRTAGTGERDEDFEFWPHVMETTVEQVQADAAAAAAALRDQAGVERVAAVGFCFGGTQAFLAAANPDLGLDRVVGFYGSLESSRMGLPAPAEEAPKMRCPVLGLFGGADENILPEHVERFDGALADAGVEHEIVTYPGAPHSFFDRKYEEHADACADAWRRTLAFLG